jgi:hypothetical protein
MSVVDMATFMAELETGTGTGTVVANEPEPPAALSPNPSLKPVPKPVTASVSNPAQKPKRKKIENIKPVWFAPRCNLFSLDAKAKAEIEQSVQRTGIPWWDYVSVAPYINEADTFSGFKELNKELLEAVFMAYPWMSDHEMIERMPSLFIPHKWARELADKVIPF